MIAALLARPRLIAGAIAALAAVLIVAALLRLGGADERAKADTEHAQRQTESKRDQAQIATEALAEADVTLERIDRLLVALRAGQTALADVRPTGADLGASHALDAPDEGDFARLYAAFADADERLRHAGTPGAASGSGRDPRAPGFEDVRPGGAA